MAEKGRKAVQMLKRLPSVMSGSGICGAFSAEQMALHDIEMEVTEPLWLGKDGRLCRC